jgi:hypothetical protein
MDDSVKCAAASCSEPAEYNRVVAYVDGDGIRSCLARMVTVCADHRRGPLAQAQPEAGKR